MISNILSSPLLSIFQSLVSLPLANYQGFLLSIEILMVVG